MKPAFLPLVLIAAIIVATGCGRAEDKSRGAKASPEERAKDSSSEIELVGTVLKPRTSKMAHQLEIYPAGNLKMIEMLGDKLKHVPAGAAVRVRGVVKSQVVGPAKDDPDPYPIQWGVWLKVSDVQVFPSVEEAFRELRERHLRERDR